jgi:small-conductance mechanosensitive channel
LDKCAKVLTEPHCLVVISEITPEEIIILAKPWVKTLDYWDTYYELVAALHLELQNRQIAVFTIGLDNAQAL